MTSFVDADAGAGRPRLGDRRYRYESVLNGPVRMQTSYLSCRRSVGQGVGQVLATGRRLSGRYRIDEPLGTGGMATVWRGQDLRLRRPVAIKELAGPWLADPTAIARFHREALIAARLTHPNIVSVYDAG